METKSDHYFSVVLTKLEILVPEFMSQKLVPRDTNLWDSSPVAHKYLAIKHELDQNFVEMMRLTPTS